MKIFVCILALTGFAYLHAVSNLTHVAMGEASGITGVYTQIAQHPDQIPTR